MAKYEKDHKPTGDHAQKAKLPKDFQIAKGIHVLGHATALTKGSEEAYAASEPSVADVKRLVEAGALVILDDSKNAVAFDVEAQSKASAKAPAAGKSAPPAKDTGDTPPAE